MWPDSERRQIVAAMLRLDLHLVLGPEPGEDPVLRYSVS